MNSFSNLYLHRYASKIRLLPGNPPAEDLGMVVAIPALAEENLIDSLESLKNCLPPPCPVEVMVLINQPIPCDPEINKINETSYYEALSWSEKNSQQNIRYYIFYVKDLPEKHAGVGLARKILLDEGVRRLEQARNPKGILCFFDADCTCDPNYLQAVYAAYQEDPETHAGLIYFEHELKDPAGSVDEGIGQYELHLRSVVHLLRYTGYPYAWHTIGSCITVRSDIYQKAGGMNKRKAGEDFYFLQKIFPLDHITEINNTRIIPSGRISDRVPFGTGKAMMDWKLSTNKIFKTRNPASYMDLRKFFDQINFIYSNELKTIRMEMKNWPESIQIFCRRIDFINIIEKIKRESRNPGTFKKKFFHHFDGLTVMKFLHYCRDSFYPDVPVEEAASWLVTERYNKPIVSGILELLMILRNADREGIWFR